MLSACVANPAPRHWLPRPSQAALDPYGAWVQIDTGRKDVLLEGELLAVSVDSVYVLVNGGRVLAWSLAQVRSARLATFDADWSGLAAYTAALSVSTLSHGYGFVLTMPFTAIIGTAATASHTRSPIVDVKRGAEWGEASRYARFPAGLPPDLPRTLPVKQMYLGRSR